MKHFLKFITLLIKLIILSLIIGKDIVAQEVVAILTPDEEAYVYHDQLLPLGYGFNIYRTHAGEEIKLNDEPVFAASSGHEFRRILGDLYPTIEGGMEVDSPQQAFLRLRGESFNRTILSFTYPPIAASFGKLFVDKQPIVDQEVSYRFELVNHRGVETGEIIESSLVVEESEINQPEEVEVERVDDEIHIHWEYPEATRAIDDIVMRFDVHMSPDDQEHFIQVSEESRLKFDDQSEFSYTIEADEQIERAEFIIEAIDITGQNRIASEPVEVELIDMTQPPSILEVDSRVVDGAVELTWPISTDPNVAGYHIDRVNIDTEEEIRLTEELIDLREPFYRDLTIVPDYNFQYYVIAVSETGVESEMGNPAMENILSVQYPEPPSNVMTEVHFEDEFIEVTWEHAEKDELFNTYVVLRRTYEEGEQRGGFSQINEGRLTEDSIIDYGIAGEGFTEGRFYEYGVVSANRQGRRSDTLFAVVQMPNITPPEPPVSFETSIYEGARINVVWGASPSTDVTTYNVYKIDQDQDTTIINKPKGNRFMPDNDVTIGTEYTYFVTAVDSSGNESQPTRESVLTMNDFSPPPSVRNIQAVETNEGVRLRWESSPSNDLEGYIVKRSPLINGQYLPLNEEFVTDTNWVDEDGEAGLWYRIYAVDQSGNQSRPSSPRQATSRN